MPGQSFSRRIASARAELPDAFKQSNSSDADTDALFRRHASGDTSALNQIVQNYLPLVVSTCLAMKRGRPDYYRDDLDVLVSDGCIGLVKAIEHCGKRGDASGLVKIARQSIRWSVRREIASRSDFGVRAFYRRGQMNALRTRLMTTLGRVPTPDEVTRELTTIITNPMIQMGHTPELQSLNDDGGDHSATLLETIAGQSRSPEQVLMNRELMRLVMRGMDPVDRRIFRMVLRGDTLQEIGRVLDVSRQRVHQRLNGLLWTLQRRADLAKYLGTESRATPAEAKPASGSIRTMQLRAVG